MSVATKVSYGGKKYLVAWNGTTKQAAAIDVWVEQGDSGFWREIWSSASLKPKSSLISAVIATADAK